MTEDIVERLRRDLMDISYDQIEEMAHEAADEIEGLRMELAAAIGSTRRLVAEIERMKAGKEL